MTITDEMVAAAIVAAGFPDVPTARELFRAALETAAPLIAAQARRQALEEAAKVARGPYKDTSDYDQASVFYGSDLTPGRSDFDRGVDSGLSQAATAIRDLANKNP